jgi:AcrR family transcriptional regulator
MSIGELVVRKRDAAATRASLLAAATAHFAREAYDSVSLRAIAADAGVDVSLVSRYFGGKEELFAAVLESCPPPDEMFTGDQSDFGVRMARMLIDDPLENDKFDIFLVMLRSASHPGAAEAIRKSGQERFYGPFADWLGGKNAPERVRVAAGIMKGVMIDRRISEDFGLTPKERDRFRARLAKVLQAAIDP